MITDFNFKTKKEAIKMAESSKEYWKYVGIAKDLSSGEYVAWRTNSKTHYGKFLNGTLDKATKYSDIIVLKNLTKNLTDKKM